MPLPPLQGCAGRCHSPDRDCHTPETSSRRELCARRGPKNDTSCSSDSRRSSWMQGGANCDQSNLGILGGVQQARVPAVDSVLSAIGCWEPCIRQLTQQRLYTQCVLLPWQAPACVASGAPSPRQSHLALRPQPLPCCAQGQCGCTTRAATSCSAPAAARRSGGSAWRPLLSTRTSCCAGEAFGGRCASAGTPAESTLCSCAACPEPCCEHLASHSPRCLHC